MALFAALLFLTLPGSGARQHGAFISCFYGPVFDGGSRQPGSTFQMICGDLSRQITALYNVKLRGGAMSEREAVTDTAAALRFYLRFNGAVGGYALFQKRFGTLWH